MFLLNLILLYMQISETLTLLFYFYWILTLLFCYFVKKAIIIISVVAGVTLHILYIVSINWVKLTRTKPLLLYYISLIVKKKIII